MSAYMGLAYDNMRTDMSTKLGGYMTSLQARYGDPRVYESQRQQMEQQVASVVYAEAQTRSEALRGAYEKTRGGVSAAHESRMSSRRGKSHGSSAPPERHTAAPAAP